MDTLVAVTSGSVQSHSICNDEELNVWAPTGGGVGAVRDWIVDKLLEGGADNDQVYSFAWFHYVVAGLGMSF